MNKHEEGFKIYAAVQGFDIQGFDKWLPTLAGSGAHTELQERREAALRAAVANNEAEALRHLEWMMLRWRAITRAEVVAPLAKKGAAFKPKGRGAGIWRKRIAAHLKKYPEAKNPELWAAVASKPPRGWDFYDNKQGKYGMGPGGQSIAYSTFCNTCSEERKKLTM